MLFATVDQGYVFLLMLAAGVAIGALYDVLALVRKLLEAGFVLSLIADLALGIGTAIILALALVWANYGQVRAYSFLAAALGIALYALGISRPMHAFFRYLSKWLRRLGGKLKKSRLIQAVFR